MVKRDTFNLRYIINQKVVNDEDINLYDTIYIW